MTEEAKNNMALAELDRFIGEIIGSHNISLVMTALTGANLKAVRQLGHPASKGTNNNDLKAQVAIHTCERFETLIQEGNTLSTTLEIMRNEDWLERIRAAEMTHGVSND